MEHLKIVVYSRIEHMCLGPAFLPSEPAITSNARLAIIHVLRICISNTLIVRAVGAEQNLARKKDPSCRAEHDRRGKAKTVESTHGGASKLPDGLALASSEAAASASNGLGFLHHLMSIYVRHFHTA